MFGSVRHEGRRVYYARPARALSADTGSSVRAPTPRPGRP
jgi:hypothetical protein